MSKTRYLRGFYQAIFAVSIYLTCNRVASSLVRQNESAHVPLLKLKIVMLRKTGFSGDGGEQQIVVWLNDHGTSKTSEANQKKA